MLSHSIMVNWLRDYTGLPPFLDHDATAGCKRDSIRRFDPVPRVMEGAEMLVR